MFSKSFLTICLVSSTLFIGCNNSSKVPETQSNPVSDTLGSAPVKSEEPIEPDTVKTDGTQEKQSETKSVSSSSTNSKKDTEEKSFKKITGEKSSQQANQPGAASTTEKPDFKNGEMLIAQSDCFACHKLDEKLVGPGYKEVAQKYDGSQKSIDYLAGKIINGGTGVWGEVYMPPHSSVSAEDAKAMAAYILSLK